MIANFTFEMSGNALSKSMVGTIAWQKVLNRQTYNLVGINLVGLFNDITNTILYRADHWVKIVLRDNAGQVMPFDPNLQLPAGDVLVGAGCAVFQQSGAWEGFANGYNNCLFEKANNIASTQITANGVFAPNLALPANWQIQLFGELIFEI